MGSQATELKFLLLALFGEYHVDRTFDKFSSFFWRLNFPTKKVFALEK